MATVIPTTWEDLLDRVLQLPPDEREKIARALYESLACEDQDEDPAM